MESIEARGHRSAVPFDVPRENGRWVNAQVIRPNGVIGGQNQGHGPGISTGAMHGEKRQAEGNINFWRSS